MKNLLTPFLTVAVCAASFVLQAGESTEAGASQRAQKVPTTQVENTTENPSSVQPGLKGFRGQLYVTGDLPDDSAQGGVVNTGIGLALLGSIKPQDALIGWANAWMFESYQHADLYGLFTGFYGGAKSVSGLQVSLANATSQANGIQIGFLGNLSGGNVGLQIAPFVNYSMDCDAIQIAGLGNLAAPTDMVSRQQKEPKHLGMAKQIFDLPRKTKLSAHAQIALVNASSFDEDYSIQIGLINSSVGPGIQIGLINYNEDAWIKVMPLINFTF